MISVTFNPPQQSPQGRIFLASLNIPNPDPRKSTQVVQLTGTIAGNALSQEQLRQLQEKSLSANGAPAAATTTPTPTSPGAGTSPIDLTYLSGIMTALGGIKSGITYSPSSFQPTTQAFELLIEKALKDKDISPYSATSALDLSTATATLTDIFGRMLAYGSDVSNWATQCKPAGGNAPGGNGQTSSLTGPVSPECNKPNVVVDLAIAPAVDKWLR